MNAMPSSPEPEAVAAGELSDAQWKAVATVKSPRDIWDMKRGSGHCFYPGELAKVFAALAKPPEQAKPEPHQCVCGSWGVCHDCGPQPDHQPAPDAMREALRNIVDAKNSYRDWQNGVRDDGPSGEARCQHLFRCIDTLDAALATIGER